MEIPTVIEAVKALTPQGFAWDGDKDCLIWLEKNTGDPPTRAEIDAKLVELQTEWDAQEYARNRQAEYPDWGTQLNKIYDDGIEKWKSEMVDPIKAKYPKP
jgi:hypothetical protein